MGYSSKELVKKQLGDNQTSEIVQSFLWMIADNTLGSKSKRDEKNKLIKELFDEGFEINDPSGTKKIGSKVLQQAMWRVMSKVKFLDSTIHGTQKDENVERLVSEGVSTIADRGGLGGIMRGKCGVFFNAFMYS